MMQIPRFGKQSFGWGPRGKVIQYHPSRYCNLGTKEARFDPDTRTGSNGWASANP